MTVIAGERATGRDLRFIRPIFARLAGDVTMESSDVFVDVPGLTVSVPRESRYLMDGYIAYESATAADIRLQILGPPRSSNGSNWSPFGLATGAGSAGTGDLDAFRVEGTEDAINDWNWAGGSGGATWCMPHGRIRTRDLGGAFQVRFCQNTSTASPTVIKAGSWIRLVRLAT